MRVSLTVAVSLLGAIGFGAIVLTNAVASPLPSQSAALRAAPRAYTFNGRVTVNNVLRVQKNASVYGHLYAHGGMQLWQGLLVRSGGIKADSLDVTGPVQVQSATVAGVLQAGPITGTSLSLTGGATLGGTLTASGKVTGDGLDAGTGGLTTSGNVSAAGISASSVDDSGALTAGPASFSSLTVTGAVNFTGASVSGLSISNLNLSGTTVQSLNVGTPTGSTAPLNVSQNGHTAQIGVAQSGALALADVTASGSLTVAGGITTSTVQGTSGSGGNGALTLQGSGIVLAGNTQLAGGSTLSFTTSGTSASHILTAGDRDIAGTATVHVAAGATPSGDFTTTVTFLQPYTSAPVVVITPATDPDPDQDAMPKVWVTLQYGTGQYTGFTIHYRPFHGQAATSHDVTFDYHVIG